MTTVGARSGRRLRVAVVVYDYPSPGDPAPGRFHAQHVAAIAGNHEVEVFQARLVASLRSGRPHVEHREADGVPVHRLSLTGPPVLGHRTLGRLLLPRIASYDIVHSMSLEAAYVARNARGSIPWVHSEHSSEWTNPVATGLLRPWTELSRRSVARADAVTAVSDYLAESVRRRTRGSPPITVWPNVIRIPPAFDVTAHPVTPIGSAHREAVRLVGVGYLVANKRPEVALDTLRILVGRGVDARLRWIGEGPMHDALLDRAARTGLQDRFEIVPFCEPEAYLGQVADADAFLVPTAYETFFVSAAEAIAVGTPVVTGDVGGQRDFVDERNGRLVAGADPLAYADAVQSLLAHPVDRVAEAERIRQRFSVESAGAAIDEVYRRLLA